MPLSEIEIFSPILSTADKIHLELDSSSKTLLGSLIEEKKRESLNPLAHFEEIPEVDSEESFLSSEKHKFEEHNKSKEKVPGPTSLKLEFSQKVQVRPHSETILMVHRNRINEKMSIDPEMGSSMFEEVKSVEKSDPGYEF